MSYFPWWERQKKLKKITFTIKSNIIIRGENPLDYLYSYQGHISSLDKLQ